MKSPRKAKRVQTLPSNEVPWAPPRTIRWFPAGAHCSNLQPGDLVLVAHATGVARIIRWGQRLAVWRGNIFRPKRRKILDAFTWANHAGIGLDGNVLSEQIGKGNRQTPLDYYAAKTYAVVHFDVDSAQRQAALDMALAFDGVKYGWLSIFGIALDILTGMRLTIGSGRRFICSAMAAQCLVALGLRPDKLLEGVMPMDLARYTEAGQ